MKPIEGVDLSALLAKEEEELKKEAVAKAQKQINGILININQWEAERTQAFNRMTKAEAKIKKAQDKLAAIRAGRWEVLGEENEGQKKPGAADAVDED